MDTIHTLTQLLTNSHCEYQVFDLGRRITQIDPQAFSKVEVGQQAYPYPMQRKAHLAIAYWNEAKQPWIWFLKFDLDERGLLKQSDIGNFIKYVIEAMGTRLGGELSEEQQDKLSQNPYTFKPSEDKMAVFHSQVRASLTMPTSQYYEHAQHYFTGGLGWENWQTIGLQGIADICARLNAEQNGVMLRKAIRNLPNEPLYALLGVLEHCDLPEKLGATLEEKALEQCHSDNPDLFLLSALVRALSGSGDSLNRVVDEVLKSPRLSHQEVLIGLAGRSWAALADTDRAGQFLLRLAQTGNQGLFNQLFADLVMLPELRMVLLPLLHNAPSPELADALIKLQQSTRTQ
ncbi:conserved hypothetical protein [Vibrio nigripulchritudo SFn27]|uniref:DUF3549 domain-containing protein n=1 Tax=Vibrio nigripulchritudo TaxID=28173 RepID=U4KDI5_9VIBR|nr:DUF3549 family protein [Vibrio nigripulchritudo]CCN85002.1 conserved hypothetical protein [Vibrio nigripulchritudo BLFn1]CCN90214.1 conserved hypothetical protein [Vibrio nigripulchritudo SFn27]CCN94174.1 conserved hypothetical protein [Vibrio nigripulchritudo ENn2]CCO42528.1 conserved hypothetical protein [Vibrio nigripulchritudo SFn135]CCO51369.1 conserved hypothetical protein [Vibrio nigripulchritudo Wn13]